MNSFKSFQIFAIAANNQPKPFSGQMTLSFQRKAKQTAKHKATGRVEIHLKDVEKTTVVAQALEANLSALTQRKTPFEAILTYEKSGAIYAEPAYTP